METPNDPEEAEGVAVTTPKGATSEIALVVEEETVTEKSGALVTTDPNPKGNVQHEKVPETAEAKAAESQEQPPDEEVSAETPAAVEASHDGATAEQDSPAVVVSSSDSVEEKEKHTVAAAPVSSEPAPTNTNTNTKVATVAKNKPPPENDDVTSKAAIALAAVAAAAMANNISPKQAAEEARATAQAFISVSNSDSSNYASSNKVRTMQTVRMAAVKARLRQTSMTTASETNVTSLLDKMCGGHNDSFLEHLLLLEYFRCSDTAGLVTDDLNQHDDDDDKTDGDIEEEEEERVAQACERVTGLLKTMESAYGSLEDLLPTTDRKATSLNADDVDDFQTTVVVPDLLPPCTFPRGDATVAFFRSCCGEQQTKTTEHASVADADVTSTLTQLEEGQSNDSLDQPSTTFPPLAKQGAGMFSSIFKRTTSGPVKTPFANVFRKNKGGRSTASARTDDSSLRSMGSVDSSSSSTRPGEYIVRIEREMLGLTVENVLERTVVRTVLTGGPARKAGAKVGSLIVKVGNVETNHLTHFETIDELRRSQRPLQLVLRQISDDSLRSAREEMGRLIRGSGFGTIMDGNRSTEGTEQSQGETQPAHPLIGNDLRIDAFTNLMRRRFAEVSPQTRNKKEEALARVGEKLAWILTLLVIGLEKEASRLFPLASAGNDSESPKRNPHALYHHSAKDYADAAKSVGKVVLDFARKKIDPDASNAPKSYVGGLDAAGIIPRRKVAPPPPPSHSKRGRGGRQHPMVPGMASKADTSMVHEKPLLQIGDVLQRTRTFLADTTSPPSALLRGELIAFLCDVLDIDTEMELSEDESVSATSGGKGSAINDLGSAGSLLKLIVLSCPTIRSPGCEDDSSRDENIVPELEEELRRRFGPRENFSTGDLHRLHAGNRFLAVVHRLAASRSTSARITACSLGPVVWGHLDFPHQLQLRGVITRALHDVEVIVRKSIATVLHEIAELVFDPRSVPWLVLMCERAMTDPEPQLRSAAMTLTWHLADHLPNAFLGDASQGSRYLRRLPERSDPIFTDVYLLQCKLLPVATRLAEDRSPSVRLAVAAQCDRLCDALGDHWSSVVIDVLLALLSDADERVRCEAVLCVPRLAMIVLLSTTPGQAATSEMSILEGLVPASIKLQKDPVTSVRVALAASAGELLTLLVAMQSRVDHELHVASSESNTVVSDDGDKRYKRQVDERLIPLVQQLLNDADPEVTSAALRAVTNASRDATQGTQSRKRHMSVASEDDTVSLSSHQSHASRQSHMSLKEPVFMPVLSEGQVLRLLPTLTELAESRQWRVRQSAVEIVPALLGCTKKHETRTEISKLCLRLMNDSVDAVRKTAAECLCMGGSSLGSHGENASAEWIISIVLPMIRKCAVHASAKQRLLSLKMVETILLNGACPAKWNGAEDANERMTDSPMRELTVISLSLATDRIANVRLTVGRVLEAVIHIFEDDDVSYIIDVLLEQIESEKGREGGGDGDVLFFATRCVNRGRLMLEDQSLSQDEP
jgi:hypothetical protein